MSIVVVLQSDDIIDGKVRVAGEVVAVPDSYANVRRVLRNQDKDTEDNAQDFFAIGLRKLQAILQSEFPQFWAALQKKPAVQDKIIQELREQPKFLRQALDEPAWFVKTVTERLNAK